MADDDAARSKSDDEERSSKTLRNYILGGAAVVITGLVSAGLIGFTNMVVTGDKTGTKLGIQVELLTNELKEQRSDFKERDKDQTRMLQQIASTIPTLYTREEARQNNEAADRRFQLLALQFAELKTRVDEQNGNVGRRLEMLERAVSENRDALQSRPSVRR